MQPKVAAEIISSLKEAGVDFVASLTEANLHELIIGLGEERGIEHVPVTREEEGIGICAGAFLGGKRPAMVMMNAGFLLASNALATVCIHPGIPVLLLIGHSGGAGEENPGHATVGMLTEPVLQALNIMYEKIGRVEELRRAILDAQTLARSSRRPVALLLNKEALR
ncbi:MAG: sulfopyruvate decarboxylase subunit alpha [Deltaproteobacteria bacterium]|nr:sulfopyruvate decarboxylase subunit alpha [Deltaproteobacteria bacterium]